MTKQRLKTALAALTLGALAAVAGVLTIVDNPYADRSTPPHSVGVYFGR